MSKWTIRKRILASFGIILALIVVTAIIAYTRLSAIETDTRALQGDSLVYIRMGLAVGSSLARARYPLASSLCAPRIATTAAS